jgi:hypothetical protein
VAKLNSDHVADHHRTITITRDKWREEFGGAFDRDGAVRFAFTITATIETSVLDFNITTCRAADLEHEVQAHASTPATTIVRDVIETVRQSFGGLTGGSTSPRASPRGGRDAPSGASGEVRCKVSWTGVTALMCAARCGHYATVQLLLRHHADLTLKTPKGVTALSIAAELGHTDICQLLIEKKADVHGTVDGGGGWPGEWSPLMIASFTNQTEAMRELITGGRPPRAPTATSGTPPGAAPSSTVAAPPPATSCTPPAAVPSSIVAATSGGGPGCEGGGGEGGGFPSPSDGGYVDYVDYADEHGNRPAIKLCS